MNITLNTSTPGMDKCRKPNFTANLKGSAIRSAVTRAKDFVDVAEINEILGNVKRFGDSTTEILCENNGMVTVTNPKFGNAAHKFKMTLNEKSQNPFIEMLTRFNTENFVLKCEVGLLEKRFALTKPSSRKALYDLYKSSNLAAITENALDFAARKQGVIGGEFMNKDLSLEKFKAMLFPQYFRK